VAPGAVSDIALPNGLKKRLRREEHLGNHDSGAGRLGELQKLAPVATPTVPPRLLPSLPPVGSIGGRRL
jgi:hypothetical protein